MPRLLLPVMLLLTACSQEAPPPAQRPADDHADLVITDARIWTGNPDAPWAEALAVDAGLVLAVGDNASVAALIGPRTEVLEAPGGMVTPGFIDTHVHFAWAGDGLTSVQLRDAVTPEAFTARIGAFAEALEPGEWILNGAWDHENWGGELPRAEWIDAATPDNPVWITRLDGHMALANTKAMEIAGIDAGTADVAGGEITRDPDGTPAGVFKDNAMDLVARWVPEPSPFQQQRMIRAAMAHVAAQGVTTIHDMADFRSMEAYRALHEHGELETRIYSIVPLSEWAELAELVAEQGTGDEWLRIGGLKGFMDGSLGSHTAAFEEPFTDAPDDRGLLINDPEDMEQWTADADAAGLQVVIHAIGDRAIGMLLDIFEGVRNRNGARDRRFRIEHAQHIAAADIPRFAELDVIASMQPYHAIDDGRWAERVIGPERARTTYAFASLMDSGAHVAFGSDWPVAPPTPLEGIYAAVTRRTLDGRNPEGWVPEQKIGVEQALRAYTVEGAHASFDEDVKGSLEPGKLADLVILDADLTAIPPETIRDVRVLRTLVGGRTVYAAP